MAEADVGISTPEVAARYRKGIDAGRIPDLDELFEEARQHGGDRIKLYACTTSVKLLHLGADMLGEFDGLLGHASFLRIAENSHFLAT
jgi:predicted peroxiredoxin